jgi:hypothetical protein
MSNSQSIRGARDLVAPQTVRNRLLYGVNEATGWRHLAEGPHRDELGNHLRAIGTRIIRIYVFDRYTPNPVKDWPGFARYVEAVLAAGATPMITLSRFCPPFDNVAVLRWFAQRCGELVWSCIEQWGGEVVREWYWCIWNEPNSPWLNPGLDFDRYRRIYVEVASEMRRWLAPYSREHRILIGGPALDTFQPFWQDWLWRFVHEIDDSLIGFVIWHRFGEWRAPGEWSAPRHQDLFLDLLMSRSSGYADTAAIVGDLVRDRGILNICGRLNANAHVERRASDCNQTIFGAVYYVLALVNLMRGGADAELYWVATDAGGPHGLWDQEGCTTPPFRAKQLIAQAIRPGDEILIEEDGSRSRELLLVRVRRPGGDRATLIVHATRRRRTYRLTELTSGRAEASLQQLDEATPLQEVATSYVAENISFNGFGIAVATGDVSVLP